MALASCSLMVSLKPVERMTGMSGRICRISSASSAPVILGMVWSVMTTSKESGSSQKISGVGPVLHRVFLVPAAPAPAAHHENEVLIIHQENTLFFIS